VADLVIKPRRIEAIVAGSEPYEISISIAGLPKKSWNKVKQDCSAEINSLLDLLAGRFSEGVMQRLTRANDGLFPSPTEIEMECSCPDYSYCCKHIAAVMYGVGARLDTQPELLFLLRQVDHQELISAAVSEENLNRELAANQVNSLAGEDLSAIFGIELETAGAPSSSAGNSSTKRPSRTKKTKPVKAGATRKVRGKNIVAEAIPATVKSVGQKRAARLKPPKKVVQSSKRGRQPK